MAVAGTVAGAAVVVRAAARPAARAVVEARVAAAREAAHLPLDVERGVHARRSSGDSEDSVRAYIPEGRSVP